MPRASVSKQRGLEKDGAMFRYLTAPRDRREPDAEFVAVEALRRAARGMVAMWLEASESAERA